MRANAKKEQQTLPDSATHAPRLRVAADKRSLRFGSGQRCTHVRVCASTLNCGCRVAVGQRLGAALGGGGALCMHAPARVVSRLAPPRILSCMLVWCWMARLGCGSLPCSQPCVVLDHKAREATCAHVLVCSLPCSQLRMVLSSVCMKPGIPQPSQ